MFFSEVEKKIAAELKRLNQGMEKLNTRVGCLVWLGVLILLSLSEKAREFVDLAFTVVIAAIGRLIAALFG